jgi:hypothetical protein
MMKTTEILSRLHQAEFTERQARELAKIFEDSMGQQVTREQIEMAVTKAKYELVKWIVAGVVVNGVVATLLKYTG